MALLKEAMERHDAPSVTLIGPNMVQIRSDKMPDETPLGFRERYAINGQFDFVNMSLDEIRMTHTYGGNPNPHPNTLVVHYAAAGSDEVCVTLTQFDYLI